MAEIPNCIEVEVSTENLELGGGGGKKKEQVLGGWEDKK